MDKRTSGEVLAMVEERGVEFVDFRFCDLPGIMQHVTSRVDVLERGHVRGRPRLRRLVDPRVPADPGVGHDPDPGSRRPPTSTRSMPRKTLIIHCYVADPRHRSRATAVTPATWRQKAEDVPDVDRHRRHGVTSGPSPSSSSSTTCASTTAPTRRSTSSTRSRACGTPAATSGRNLGYKPRTKQGYFPVPPMDHYQDLRSEMAATLDGVGIEVELHHHEVATGGQGEIGTKFNTLLRDGRPADDVQVRPQERGLGRRQDADVHAEADLPGQRLGHAHPPVAVEGRRAAVLRRDRLRRAVRHRPLVHRRPAAPRPGDPRVRRARRRTPTSGWCPATRRRSTSCTRSATGRRRAASRWRRRARRPSASSSAAPTRRRNPYLAFSAMLHGRPRRRAQPDRAAGPGRQGPLRPPARGAGQGAPGARLARRVAARRSRPTTPS